MASEHAQMYHIASGEPTNNKENVVLRALAADPSRYKPVVNHPPATNTPAPARQKDNAPDEPPPTSMYTLKSRYRPIPEKVLPKPIEAQMHYINSNQAEPPKPATPPPAKIEREAPLAVAPEPEMISQPILYSIVGDTSKPVHEPPPAPVQKDMPMPILYSITGQVQRPKMAEPENVVRAASPPAERSVILYSLIGNPKSEIIVEKSIKPQEVIPVPRKDSLFVPHDPTAGLYLIVGGPQAPTEVHAPLKAVKSLPTQSSPILYSIVGRPKATSVKLEPRMGNPPPPPEPAFVQSTPILYTIVGGKTVPSDIPVEVHPPPAAPSKKQANHAVLHTTVGDPKMPKLLPSPQKISPVQLRKQPPLQQPSDVASMYPLVGKPRSPSREDIDSQPRPCMRSRIPLPQIGTTRRRSVEHDSAPETERAGISPKRQKKNRGEGRSKERTIPKSETIFIPLPDSERQRRPRQPLRTPWQLTPGQLHRRPFAIPQYDPLQLPDYISPYAYHPSRPYHERTCHPTSLPIVKTRRQERRPRPLDGSPRSARKNPSDPWMYHSLERPQNDKNAQPRQWDYENRSYSDMEDEPNEMRTHRKPMTFGRYRIRTPWAPVW